MNNTGLFLAIFGVLLLVAVLKFAWSQSTARRQSPRGHNADDNDWDAVQQHGHGRDGGWDSSHHSESSLSDSSHSDSSHSDGGGDSSSD